MQNKNKITYAADLIPLEDALKFFETADDIFGFLRSGRVIGYGRSYSNIEMDKPTGKVFCISPETWSDLTLNDNHELFGQVEYDLGQYEYECIGDINIDKTTIESLQRRPKGHGRPAKYDWDNFWRSVALHLHLEEDVHGDAVPSSLGDWARNVHYAYPFLWEKGKEPKETTIEDKLRPLFDAMNNRSFAPIKGQIMIPKVKSGGN